MTDQEKMNIRTKYITTKSKESIDNNKILLSIDSDGDVSLIQDMKGILLYADQVQEFLRFVSLKGEKL